MTKPKILVAIQPDLYRQLFAPETDQALRAFGDVTYVEREDRLSASELAALVPGYEGVLTSWGVPRFTDEVLDAADALRIIAHAAGSIKAVLPPPVFERGIAVTHAASAIAGAVADLSLALTMLLLRRVHALARILRQGDWRGAKNLPMGREIAGTRVGVVGAGYTGRWFIRMLRAVDAEVWVYDPYLSEERARELEVKAVELNTLFAECPVVSVQAPSPAETYHMVGAEQLRLMPDGTCFVNTARSWVIDYDALLAELQTGRIQAALDVFDQEPLPEDNPFRKLENVILTPHIAGASVQARHRQGRWMLKELQRFFAGEPLRYGVTIDMLDVMA